MAKTPTQKTAAQQADFKDLILALYRRLGAFQRDEICCEGVTVSQCYTLQVLANDGEMTAGELCELLGIEASTGTRAVDVLVRNGSVERVRPEAGDRRRVLLRLTRKGRALAKKLMACGDDLFQQVLGRFSTAETPIVLRTLQALQEALGEVAQGTCGKAC